MMPANGHVLAFPFDDINAAARMVTTLSQFSWCMDDKYHTTSLGGSPTYELCKIQYLREGYDYSRRSARVNDRSVDRYAYRRTGNDRRV